MNRIVRTLAALLVTLSLTAAVTAPAEAASSKRVTSGHQWCC